MKTSAVEKNDAEWYFQHHIEDWKASSCPPETLAEAELKLRQIVLAHARASEEASTPLHALADEAGFCVSLLEALTIRRVRKLKYDLSKRLDLLESAIASLPVPTVQGTFNPHKKDYHRLDIVSLNGASFAAKRDNPGPCPGDGWQLIAGQGKRGRPGERGPAGAKLTRASVDDNGMVTFVHSDGATITLDLYPLLLKVQGG